MADAFSLAQKHLEAGIAEAADHKIELNAYGQALFWKLLEYYREDGRPLEDIVSEVQYTLDNFDDDGTFHVSRN